MEPAISKVQLNKYIMSYCESIKVLQTIHNHQAMHTTSLHATILNRGLTFTFILVIAKELTVSQHLQKYLLQNHSSIACCLVTKTTTIMIVLVIREANAWIQGRMITFKRHFFNMLNLHSLHCS